MAASWRGFDLFPCDDGGMSGFWPAGGRKGNPFGDFAIAVPWILNYYCVIRLPLKWTSLNILPVRVLGWLDRVIPLINIV